jgi:hypothetical protein
MHTGITLAICREFVDMTGWAGSSTSMSLWREVPESSSRTLRDRCTAATVGSGRDVRAEHLERCPPS